MAYVTGQAADINALRTAIFGACTANGWTLNTDVLSKGGVFLRITVVGTHLDFLGGLGIDGSDELTTPGPWSPVIADSAQAITYPVTYEVHILTSPDEVYVVIEYAGDFYQWAAWGQSDVAGLPGAGVWYAASKGHPNVRPFGAPDSGINGGEMPYLFTYDTPAVSSSEFANSFLHHGFDGGGWNPENQGVSESVTQPNAWEPARPLPVIQPNAWNDEAILVPIQVWVARADGDKMSLGADLRHARYLRIDFHDPGDIITLGPDAWKVYPSYRKDATDRDVLGGGAQHTGTFGWAVRYTGP